jgi:ribosomal peptide maturation radical SAM protein 1
MPFGSVHRPALGVSLLKAASSDARVDTKIHYFNLKFAERTGLELYDRLSEYSLNSALIGELIFASFVFATHAWNKENIRDILRQIFEYRHHPISYLDNVLNEIIFVQELVPEFIHDCAYDILQEKPKLIGFSSTFEQNCASLALAKLIKEEQADIPIIFGGANCEGEMGAALLKCAPWVDFVCSGEGDIAFVEFIKSFIKGNPPNQKINGIITRQSSIFDIALTNPVMNMDSLPFPDFDDYIDTYRHSQLRKDLNTGVDLFTGLVVETSRGCWWGEKFQCTFCGLNGLTMKYRSKSIPRVLEELRYLTNRHKINNFVVVDNIMDLKYIDSLFPELYRQGLDVKLFYETKSNLSKQQLKVMKQGGVEMIQPGIESLSDSILKIMEKGVTGLQNIQLLKWCRELDIVPTWNLIWGFPGESEQEYDRMSRIVPLLVHLHPPEAFANITLDRFSPYFINQLQNGIKNVRPWMSYKFIYPLNEKDLQKIAYHFDFDYSDGRDPASYTAELKRQLFNWKKLWEGNYKQPSTPPPSLNIVREGEDLITINDTRPCSLQNSYMLANEEAMIYELCETSRSIHSILMKIQQEYPLVTEDKLRNVLSNLVDKKLMLCYDDKYLSLAIPVKQHDHFKVAEFLLKLQEDSKLLAAFNKDPDKVMIEAGISSEEDRNILKGRDVLKIRQLLAKKEMQ